MAITDYEPGTTPLIPGADSTAMAATGAGNYADVLPPMAGTGSDSASVSDDSLAPDIGHEQTDAPALAEVVRKLSAAVSAINDITQQEAIQALTDSSGGTEGDHTLVAIPAAVAATTDTSAASLTSTNAALTAIKNDVATLAAKVNAVIGVLSAAGVTTTS